MQIEDMKNRNKEELIQSIEKLKQSTFSPHKIPQK